MDGSRISIKTKTQRRGIVFILLFLLGLTTAHSGTMEVGAIGVGQKTGETVITLEFTESVNYRSFTLENPPRLVLDIPGVTLKEPRTVDIMNGIVKTVRYLQYKPDTVRIVVNLTQAAKSRVRKSGKKLLLYFSLSREAKARLLSEERARSEAEKKVKRKLAAKEKAGIKRKKEEAERLALTRRIELKKKAEEKKKLEAKREIAKREEMYRKRAEERAKQLLNKKVKKEVELQARAAAAKEKLAKEVSRREAKERERKVKDSFVLGEKYYQINKFDEAIKEFKIVLALDPKNEEARNYLALAGDKKKEEKSREDVRRREEAKKKKLAAYLNQGKEYYLQGRYPEAIAEGEKVLGVSPGNRRAEELITKSRMQALKVDQERAAAEQKIVEGRRALDVTKALYTSPVDYRDAINPEGRETRGGGTKPGRKAGLEETAIGGLKKQAEKTMVTMTFKDTDLREVILFLSKMSNIAIVIDEKALEELTDPRVTIYIPTKIPLTDALDLILKVKGLDYVIKDNYIWITKKGQMEEPVTKAYKLKYGIRTIRQVAPTLLGKQQEVN